MSSRIPRKVPVEESGASARGSSSDVQDVLGLRITGYDLPSSVLQVLSLADKGRSAYVCAANVHMVMEGVDDNRFRRVVNEGDVVVADGRPVVWALRLLGVRNAQQVRGSDLFLALCEEAAERGIPVGFYGSDENVQRDLAEALSRRFPSLRIACMIAPPFRPVTEEEDREYVSSINACGAALLFVGLGCPKQESWMAEHRDRIGCTMIGVGAAFDMLSGRQKQAPRFLQRCGLEWLYRLGQDPRRLWKRYLKHNPRFAVRLLFQLITRSTGSVGTRRNG